MSIVADKQELLRYALSSVPFDTLLTLANQHK